MKRKVEKVSDECLHCDVFLFFSFHRLGDDPSLYIIDLLFSGIVLKNRKLFTCSFILKIEIFHCVHRALTLKTFFILSFTLTFIK